MDKKLRMIAGSVVVESKLSNAAKKQMINFVQKEATDAQIKALLLDGKIVHLDEQAEEIVNARFEGHKLNEGVLKTIFGLFLLTPPGWVLYRAIRAAVSKASRKCGILSIGKSRDICMLRVKATKAEKLIALFKREMKNCAQSKNPAKCKAKGTEKIAKWAGELKELQARIKDLQKGGVQQVHKQSTD